MESATLVTERDDGKQTTHYFASADGVRFVETAREIKKDDETAVRNLHELKNTLGYSRASLEQRGAIFKTL